MDGSPELYFLEAFAEDREVTAYRRKLARALEWEPDAAILLQQIVYYWMREWRGHPPRQPFYKFKEVAAKHPRYQPGQSWAEELVLTRRRFEGALAQIGTKISKGVSKAEVMSVIKAEFEMQFIPAANTEILTMSNRVNLVAYWTDGERLTWYELNERLFESLCRVLYSCKVQNDFSSEPNDQNDFTHVKSDSYFTHEKSKTDFTCTKNSNHETNPAEITLTQTDRARPRAGERVRKSPKVENKLKSVHQLENWIAYFEARKVAGAPINDVQAMAYARRADGEGDELVTAWLHKRAHLDSDDQKLLRMIAELRQLHAGEPEYQQSDLIDDLRFRCQKAGLTWDEPSVRRALNEAGNDLADQNVA